MTRMGRNTEPLGQAVLWLLMAGAGCASQPKIEPAVTANSTPGRVTIAVAPALNLSGSTDFDPNRFADLMAGELTYAEGVSVVPVSRVLGVLAGQGLDRVESPAHAREIASRVGADAILVFAVTEYDPYDPPRIGISAQLLTASGEAPAAQMQRRFDASHADVDAEIRTFAQKRVSGGSVYGWRKYVVSQQHYIQYCCASAIKSLLNGRNGPEVLGAGHER